MQFIFVVPPNEELEGTLHPPKFGCTPKSEGKRVHVPPDEKTCGHTKLVIAITIKVVSLIRADGEVYSVQHQLIKFVNGLRQVINC